MIAEATRGACVVLDPDAMFVAGAAQNQAKLICSGGLTERERQALLRRSLHVRSWRALLIGAGHAQPLR